jgi:hypothetical protein
MAGRCIRAPVKGNIMTKQNPPRQPDQPPRQKLGQQQGGGLKPGQQSQAPAEGETRQPYDQTSDTDT